MMFDNMDIWQVVRDIGIFAGVVGAAFGYWVRLQADKKRLLRKVLYYLLELRYSVRFLADVPTEYKTAFKETYFDEWKKYGVNFAKEDDKGLFDEIMDVSLKKAAAAKAVLPSEFTESFYGALDSLAERYPITAYQLRGSQELGALLDYMDDVNSSVMEMVSTKFDDPEELSALEEVQEAITTSGLSDQLRVLDSLTRGIAWECSFRQWHYTKGILKNVGWGFTTNDRKMIKNLVKLAVETINSKADDITGENNPDGEEAKSG